VRLISIDGSIIDDPAESLADRDDLERAFRRLPTDQRAVVVLHHYLGIPLIEIAVTLGIPAGTARSRLHNATRRLRTALEADALDPVSRKGHAS
jgi:RNA polymerase sigma-70 factor, ECF subfamily